jgi:hypothetical protein
MMPATDASMAGGLGRLQVFGVMAVMPADPVLAIDTVIARMIIGDGAT